MRPQIFLSQTALFALLLVPVPAVHAAQAPQWTQATSDIPADPAVRFGTLPSGMRYAIMKNATPKGEVSLRLRFGTGSLQESDAQQGLAHFLEHMAFRGSTHVADGEVFKTLERLGLRTGADSNASTGQTETIYQFDLPKTDDATLDTGLMLSREIVSELTLDPAAIVAERGPVLSEERLRDGPGRHVFESQIHFLLPGQLAADRSPIGKVEVIRNATPELVADYYHAYYRPERAALVIAGDIDPEAVEAKIKARFADWNPAGTGRGDPDLGTPAARGEEARVFVEPGAPRSVSINWTSAYKFEPDTKAQRKKDRIEGIGFGIINQRMAQLAQSPEAPFLAAGASNGDYTRSVNIASLSVSYAGDGWQKALQEAERIRREVLAQGVTQAEVDRLVTASLSNAEAGVAAASTRNSRQLAGGLVNALDNDRVFNSPEQGKAMLEADLKGLTAAQVNDALKHIFEGNGPLLYLSSPDAIEGGEAKLASVFHEAESAPLVATNAADVPIWPYTMFGPPGTVAETRTLDEFGTSFVRFANGVRLTVKPTKFRADQILVSVDFAGGKLVLPKDRQILNFSAFVGGGLQAMTAFDMRRSLTGKIYGVGFGVDDDNFSLSGATRPADLDLQMEALAAYVTSPGWRPEAFQQGLNGLRNNLARVDTTPTSVFGARLPALLRSGDMRWALPELSDVDKAKLDDVKNVVAPVLAKSPIEITMVGDITLEQAVKSVAATFGTLPTRETVSFAPPRPGDLAFPAPNTEPLRLTHTGRPDQGLAAIAWPTTDVFATKESPARRVLIAVMRSRLMDQLRVANGATYSAQATAAASLIFPGYGYIAAYAEIPPDRTALFYDTVTAMTADLAANGPTADEFDRARKPEIDSQMRAVETNDYWLGALSGAQRDKRRLALIRDAMPGLEALTPDDIKRAAAKYLVADKAFKLVVAPKQ